MFSLAIGGAIGAIMRYITTEFAKRKSFYPAVTACINISGSFLFGFVIMQSNNWTGFLCAGVFGGFTTFSTFIIDFYQLLQQNKQRQAYLYLSMSILCSFTACLIGLLLGGL